jgi:hypothetical protein
METRVDGAGLHAAGDSSKTAKSNCRVVVISMYEGVPGAGKSYHAVAEVLLPWVRANRRCFLYIDGVYLDRLAAFEGRSVESLAQQITVWRSVDEVLSSLRTVDPGSGVLIDECQTVFRAKSKVDPELLRWLETHRHYGVDVVLLCQHYKQVTAGVTRLVEVTTAFRRLDRFGLTNRYQAKVRGNPEELEVIRMFSGKYDPKVYAYYSSYAAAGIKETKRGGSIVKSPTIILGLLGIVGAAWFVSSGSWLSGAPVKADTVARAKSATALPPPDLPLSSAGVVASPVVTPVRISGAMGYYSKIRKRWEYRYLTEDGKILKVEEIAGLSGGVVREVREGETVTLVGDGVVWKPVLPLAPALPGGHGAASALPAVSASGTPAHEAVGPVAPGPFATPAGF